MNHPWAIGGKGAISKKKLKEKLENDFLEQNNLLHFAAKKELIIKKKILSAAIYMNAKEDTKIYKEVIKDILCVAPEYGKKIAHMIFKRDLKCGNIFMQLEENPTENNKIVLDKKKDKLGIPMTKLFYKKSKYSLKTAKLFLEEFGNLCRKNDLGRIAIKDSIYNLEEYEELGGFHHLGGTRMGIDKFDSVVNKDLKVHGINNLYVSGSSNFVTSGYTNPTFTIIQLAIRLAEEINKRLHT
jgi:choline dehydrogenase-like flavoprotein